MKIYTGNGDNGETVNLGGQKVSKNSAVMHLEGTLDELNSHLGLIKAMLTSDDSWQVTWQMSCRFMERAQRNLMKMMAHASDYNNKKYFFTLEDIIGIEREIDRLSSGHRAINEFVIPGRNIIEAQIQTARTVARRAERYYFAAKEKYPLCPECGVYLNRMSDYLFILSQQESLINVNFINQITGI